jgi:hypothetical protein
MLPVDFRGKLSLALNLAIGLADASVKGNLIRVVQ